MNHKTFTDGIVFFTTVEDLLWVDDFEIGPGGLLHYVVFNHRHIHGQVV